jgi:transposase-like protein
MADKQSKQATPKGLTDAIRYFSDEQVCIDYVAAIRWPDGEVRCPDCKSTAVIYLKNQRRWKCGTNHARRQFSIKVGTIFEDSPLSLTKWLPAVWLISNCKNGVSSLELHRAIGVTQKTAWFMLHRIRLAMQRGSLEKIDGHVEIDETYIGGKARFMHKFEKARKIKGRGTAGKTAVMGLLSRHGAGKTTVRAMVVDRTDRETLEAIIRDQVQRGANVYTDDHGAYRELAAMEYKHKVINHAEAYVQGTVTTNRIENFWSLLKRGIKGTYVSVEPFHLFRYVDEQAFRFNERHNEDGDYGRFMEVLSAIVGRRLTYKELIGEKALTAVPA